MRNCQYSSSSDQQRRHGIDKTGLLQSRTLTNPHKHDTSHHQRAPDKDQKPRPFGIKNGTDEDAAQKSQEDVSAEDPSD